MAETLQYTHREFEGIRILDVIGNINTATRDHFVDVVSQVADKENLIINMLNVKLVTSAGIQALMEVSYWARDHGKRVILLWPNEDLLKLVDMVDVYEHIIFADSLEEARTKIKHFTQ